MLRKGGTEVAVVVVLEVAVAIKPNSSDSLQLLAIIDRHQVYPLIVCVLLLLIFLLFGV